MLVKTLKTTEIKKFLKQLMEIMRYEEYPRVNEVQPKRNEGILGIENKNY